MARQLDLPNYAEDLPEGSKLKPHLPAGWFDCMCDVPWEVLEKQELELAGKGEEGGAGGDVGAERVAGGGEGREGVKLLSRREDRSND